MSQAELFDRLAAGAQLYVYKQDALHRLNAILPNKGRVLDVGCGDGAIAEALDGGFVIGCDISRRCAQLTAGKGIPALVCDALKTFPFRDGSFDTVYCVDVLHHLEQKWDDVISHLDRVLRPGGALIIVEPDAHNPFVRWTQAPHSPIRVAPFNNEPAIYPEELEHRLRALGYEFRREPITIEASQVERSVFPLWQRLAKAPFVILLAALYAKRPNKFAIVATKPTR